VKETTEVRYGREGHVARLTFDRPKQLNALSPTLIAEAHGVAEEVAASDARVLIVSGAGKSFSAGVDLKAASAPDYTREVARRFSEQARALALLFETMSQAVIAQVSGHCYTGGLELALACDLIIASDDAVFCDTHGKLGLRPGWGLSQRLPRRIGPQRAREMSFTARKVGAEEAARIGLALEHVRHDRLMARVNALAAQIADMNPRSISAYKTLYRSAENLGLDEGLAFESSFRPPRSDEPAAGPLSAHLKSS
jgi:enoyl-CoA hydratase/carnithine racemase